MSASLLEPELRHAILIALRGRGGPRVKRDSLVRNGNVDKVHEMRIKRSFVLVGRYGLLVALGFEQGD
jgi:hypothetical protein|tara:strand:- start:949 stop:1152 length:204 start_codon:yes stop_codon:yes gene_type:complete